MTKCCIAESSTVHKRAVSVHLVKGERTLNQGQGDQYFNCQRSIDTVQGLMLQFISIWGKMIVEYFSRACYFHPRGWWERRGLRGVGKSWDFLPFRGHFPWAEAPHLTSETSQLILLRKKVKREGSPELSRIYSGQQVPLKSGYKNSPPPTHPGPPTLKSSEAEDCLPPSLLSIPL